MSDAATISRAARGFVLAGAAFLVATATAPLFDAPRSTVVALGLYGFVLHTVFGKGYSLVPTYFDRGLAAPWAPTIQLPLSALGAVALALPPGGDVASALPVDPVALGGVLWAAGAAVFLGTVGWTIRDNLSGAETGTGEAKAHLARTDRAANAVMPLALLYLAAGAYETAAIGLDAPALTGSQLAASHLLAVGTAALLVFAIGARLLPRLLRASPPTALVGIVLATGAMGPTLLVAWFLGGVFAIDATAFLHGAIATLGVAVLGHAVLVGVLLARAPAPRLGAYGVFAGGLGGLAAVAAGAAIGLGVVPELLAVHPRLGLLGFLGLTIVGVAYHFYPPTIAGEYGDQVAWASMLLLGGGLAVESAGALAGVPTGQLAGQGIAVAGAAAYAGLVAAIFRARGRA